MSVKIFVGNLAFGVDSAALEQLFARHGEVETATVVTDRSTGRSKGFGFVEMTSRDAAQAAIAELNGREHEGRPLNVDIAKAREERPGGARRSRV